MENSAARLRKTFHYPTDHDSDDSLPEALDEEEQESLISKLSTANSTLNHRYTQLFLLLPALSSLLYLRTLFRPSTSLLSLIALSSFAISAWTLYVLPSNESGLPYIDALNAPKTDSKGSRGGNDGYTDRIAQLGQSADRGPLELYLPLLNIGLVGVLFLGGWLLKEGVAWPGFGLLPGAVYVFVVGAKVVMGSVDVRELEGLKYGYKGA